MREVLSIARALADESRLRALHSLHGGELCLCQIVEVLGLAPATVSRHMNLLHEAGLVERRKDGRWHYYRLARAAATDGGRPPRRDRDPRGDAADGALGWLLPRLSGAPALRDDVRRIRRARGRDREVASACYRS